MSYQIDQSGKVENTSHDTVIAFSNGDQYAILIPRKVKRKVQELFRRQGFTKFFVYWLFSVGVYFLIKSFQDKETFTIDLEYPNKDRIISQIISKLLKSYHKPAHEINFGLIGSHPRVHYAAKNVFDGKKKAGKILTFEEMRPRLFPSKIIKVDGRLNGCISTRVGVQSRPYKGRIPRE